MDYCRNRKWISTIVVRKLSTAVGMDNFFKILNQTPSDSTILFHAASVVPAVCFIGVSFAGCDREAAVALMTVGVLKNSENILLIQC